MKKFILILAVIALALAQESCSNKAGEKGEVCVEEADTCIADTIDYVPSLQLDSICND